MGKIISFKVIQESFLGFVLFLEKVKFLPLVKPPVQDLSWKPQNFCVVE